VVDAANVGFALKPSEARDLCVAGQKIKTRPPNSLSAVHPENPEFPGITKPSSPLPCSASTVY